MKKIFLFSLAVLLINCNNLTSSKDKLNTLIEVYQNYEGNNRDEFPLGDYRESRFKKYAVFCDSIKTELETIDVKSLGEDDQITHELLHFKLKETSVKYLNGLLLQYCLIAFPIKLYSLQHALGTLAPGSEQEV